MSKVQNISYYDNILIIGKSDIKSDVFDILLFSRKNLKTVEIPPSIKQIWAFAFQYSDIKKVFFTPSITTICKYSFYKCSKL